MLGPIDATIRAALVALARTGTQLSEIALTHRPRLRDFDDFDDAVAWGFFVVVLPAGFGAAIDRGTIGGARLGAGTGTSAGMTLAGVGAGSSVTMFVESDGTTLSVAMLPALATVLESVVSGGADAESLATCAFAGASVVRFDPSPRASHATKATATSAAIPAPFQTEGAIGARSGFVPHHLHSPTRSG